ncbi:MAG: hypothetical protein JW760_10420 [Spirochaetales bacterium]|nr:hypothetical protein [Spirochaetales bacterium]
MEKKETGEDGEIIFHYRREDRIGPKKEEEGKKPFGLLRLLRLNTSSVIILLDIMILTVIFIAFRPILYGKDHIYQTDDLKIELSGFLFDQKAYASVKVTALKDHEGGRLTLEVWTDEAGEVATLTESTPVKKDVSEVFRFELPLPEGDREVFARLRLGEEEPVELNATLKE